ncbi:PorP/SprF family type IX secretion system membrane protein [Ferruginibacter sp. SUN002]|uniref:PorP/SprF family type IX secretion system membrane protein n=1 Tax=Ferruginibacter sp. SUN002 TaxID=2937789 RepID=UPI003D36C102
MNKFKLMIVGMLVLGGNVFAQQKPYYTQYILNNYILNPALTGIENYTDLKLSYRDQWTNIPGAPQTMYMTVHAPIGKADYKTTPTSFEPSGENSVGNDWYEENVTSPTHHGVGLSIINDKTGYLSRFSVAASYAYHKGLSPKTTLSLGFQAGLSSVTVDRSKIDWGNTSMDPNDPAIGYATGELKKSVPELGVGLWFYSQDFFVGASMLNIVPAKTRFVKDSKYGTYLVPHTFVSGGVRVPMSSGLTFLPSVLVQWINPEPVQVHANMKFQYENKLWFGASYRHTDKLGGFAAMAGVNISNTLNIGYSYDFASTSRLRNYQGNTHEIVVGFLLGNSFRFKCPTCHW